jgi:predicted tellurium resistance membrane protein TerC
VSLGADGLGFHIDKGYIYAAMAFAVLVEAINIVAKQRKTAAVKPEPVAAVTDELARPKRRNAAGRSQAAPKSARRKKA